MGFPSDSEVKNLQQCRRCGFHPWVRKIPWRRAKQPTPVFFAGESHGKINLVGYSPQGHKECNTIQGCLSAQGLDFSLPALFPSLSRPRTLSPSQQQAGSSLA